MRRKRALSGVRRYFADDWSDSTLPVHVFLVEHEAGLCLFDTGQTARAAAPGYFPGWYPFFRLSRFELTASEEAAAQLARLGQEPGDVRWVVLSHMHTDHVGGVGAFRAAEMLVSRSEWADAQGWGGRMRGYLPQYWPQGVRVGLVDFDGPGLGPFPGSRDVTGDGTLILVPTPGHTRGHMSLLVRDGRRSFLLGGDAAMSLEDLHETAPAVAAFCEHAEVVFLATHDSSAPGLLTASGD